ncbi:nucleotidyltransferase family protein [Rhodothermus marinus]|uniref:nucleotidyltransferase family protein n=1 Tax=Rhodothermus marinus TaxID=29549 RepID=UPI0012BA4F7B|nr:nucleotidyltransferase family protein [Rhodothermus marinus]BBM69407.1 nucleotidyltransferase [Rhodothermus marinus]BBM72389.1 nucleotidyltransferase [Rhodothermus marinus]
MKTVSEMNQLRPLSVEEIRCILAGEMPFLKERFRVKFVGLFGSVVRGEAGEHSDLDVLVEFEEPPTLFQFVELKDWLSRRLGCNVDLVMKSALRPHIKQHILQEVVAVSATHD